MGHCAEFPGSVGQHSLPTAIIQRFRSDWIEFLRLNIAFPALAVLVFHLVEILAESVGFLGLLGLQKELEVLLIDQFDVCDFG